jgi:hypothetical protein
MTKFTSSEEVGFDRVSSQLRRWVNDISDNSQACRWSIFSSSNSLFKKVTADSGLIISIQI